MEVITVFLAAFAIFCGMAAAALAYFAAGWMVWLLFGGWSLLFLLIAISLYTPKDTARLLGVLERRDSAGLYTLIMNRLLGWLPRVLLPPTAQDTPLPEKGFMERWLWHLIPMARDGDDLRRLQSNPFSWPVLDAAMKIALIYPVFFALCQWGWTGADTTIGGVVLFSAEPRGWMRIVVMSLIATMGILRIMASSTALTRWKSLMQALFWGAAIFAAAIAGAIVIIFAGAVVFASAVTFRAAGIGIVSVIYVVTFSGPAASTMATAFAFAGGFASSSVLTSAFTGAIALVVIRFIINPFTQRQRGVLGYGLFIAGLCLILITGIWAGNALDPSGTMSDGRKTLLLFLALFPMINAIFDYLSYGITISLLKRGFAVKNVWTGIYGLVDVIAAGVMFLLLSVTLVLAVAGLNRLTGQTWLDLPALFTGLETAPAAHLWVMGMIFSTLVPTVIHLIIALFSAIMWVPQNCWAGLADKIAKHHQSGLQFIGAAAVVSSIYAVYFWAITIGLFIAGQWVWQWRDPVGQGYLRLVRTIAETLGVL